eukprot:TRINITY_DN7998_c0_g3_i1.p1 TRINITY_DN7998_c0_g3~~TRINITY_DN7998_c0_g3_i1.p1  ORF type:complete len:176 (-),score=42.34 TRINITY_DN7998_c0_g3_i1:227-754(-)
MSNDGLTERYKKWHFRVPHSTPSSARSPLGYSASAASAKDAQASQQSVEARKELKIRKSWEYARSPGMGIVNQFIMLWMSGSTLSIWTIGIVAAMAFSPIKSLMNMQSGFTKYEGEGIDLRLQKLLYIVLNLVSLSFILYKFHQFGFFPTALDSALLVPPRKALEYASGGYSLSA